MRSDRDVRYCITVQYVDKNDNQIYTTGIKSHKFGFGDKTSKSEVSVTISERNTCIYFFVDISVIFTGVDNF